MKLYYSPGACSLADHIALIEAGLPYSLAKVDLKTKRTEADDDYLAVNPKGYVPALVLDDGAVVTENLAILSLIAERSGRLLAPGPLGRIRALEATAYVSGELHKNFKPFFNPVASDAERDEARATLVKRYALLADQLGEQPFLFGDALSMADCYLFVTLRWAARFEVPVGERLEAYRERVRGLPAVARALEEEGLS